MGGRARRRRERAAFFTAPSDVAQRRYEALRAYFVEQASAADVAARFGYAPSTVVAMVRDFTADPGEFFVARRPGPRVAPAKLAARDEVLRLRQAGRSVTEITAALSTTATPLNRTGVWELLVAEGHERLAPRAPGERGTPARDHPPRTRVMRWPQQPLTLRSDYAGVMLLLGALVALDLPGAVAGARFPGTREVPAVSSVLSLLALKAIGRRRVSHVDDVCTDPALAAFAGLESLPKASSLGSYSYRLKRSHDEALLAGLARSMTQTGQTQGTDFDLDFHAIMHFGDDVALETHYVPRRSQRTESVLSFFAHDGQTRNLVYANAACTKADQAGEVIAFARHWQAATGEPPELLVFDSKVTTGAGLAELHAADLTFITLRARNAKLTAQLEALPDSAWTQITLERRGPYAKPKVHEQDVTVRGCTTPLRQIAVRGLGHEYPTPILTNDRDSPPKKVVGRYAKRMRIEQRLAESIRSFHLDALSSAVALNVDLDTTLTVPWAAAAYDHLRQPLPRLQGSDSRHDLATLPQHQRPTHHHPDRDRLPPQQPHLQPRHALSRTPEHQNPPARSGLQPAVQPQGQGGRLPSRSRRPVRAHQHHGEGGGRRRRAGDLGRHQEEGAGRKLQERRARVAPQGRARAGAHARLQRGP